MPLIFVSLMSMIFVFFTTLKVANVCYRYLLLLIPVFLLQEESQHFITLENLDQKIQEVLDSPPISFNFAIDSSGQKVQPKTDPKKTAETL